MQKVCKLDNTSSSLITVCVCLSFRQATVNHLPIQAKYCLFILRNVRCSRLALVLLHFLAHRSPQTERKPSRHTLVMLGLQRDRVPDGKAWGMSSNDVCLAKMSVHTQRQILPKFRQYNVRVHYPVQTKQLELRYWQLLYVTGMWGFMCA